MIKFVMLMPKNCNACIMRDPDYGSQGGRRPYCKLLHSLNGWSNADIDDTLPIRPPNCPLVDNKVYLMPEVD